MSKIYIEDSDDELDRKIKLKKNKLQKPGKIIPIFKPRLITNYLFAPLTKYDFKNWTECFPDNVKIQNLIFNITWEEFFISQLSQQYFIEINNKLSEEVKREKNKIYPRAELLFNALNVLNLENVKVVFIGQDPYINETDGVPEAMGLCFSVPYQYKKPKSLSSIYNNLLEYKHIKRIPDNGCLAFWAMQGCLMLNTTLTVLPGKSNSHQKIWKTFTENLITYLNNNCENLVFLAWGANAHEICFNVDPKKHLIITSSHPSPMSFANTFNGYEYGLNKISRKKVIYPSFKSIDHFGLANKYLIEHKKGEILWSTIDI